MPKIILIKNHYPDHHALKNVIRYVLRAGVIGGYAVDPDDAFHQMMLAKRVYYKTKGLPFDRHANLKYKYGNRSFWCRGYYVDTVGKNAKIIGEYIRNQLEEDYASDQISLKEYMDPFTGERRK